MVFKDGKNSGTMLEILKDHGVNAIRLRLFVNPTAPGGYSPEGYCGLKRTLAVAKVVKAAGMNLLLDLHLSDTWADPAHQIKPLAWKDLHGKDLENQLRSYCRQTVQAFIKAKAEPDMVAVGNEISSGMLWPDGTLNHPDEFTNLLKAGIQGVKEADPKEKIMIHLALGGQLEQTKWFLRLFAANQVQFDVLGLSYYPEWQGTLEELKANLANVASEFHQAVSVVEYRVPTGVPVYEAVKALPNNLGVSTYLWEPTYRHQMFVAKGNATPSLHEFDEIKALATKI